ncbi:hypothetical protein [Escherichia coli]|uniref:hypothetical protein n=1 Tax=Escherichia coli TaxID=562 RepID=UPI00208DC80C|nr:hypothetical protein [Escherichia coli]
MCAYTLEANKRLLKEVKNRYWFQQSLNVAPLFAWRAMVSANEIRQCRYATGLIAEMADALERGHDEDDLKADVWLQRRPFAEQRLLLDTRAVREAVEAGTATKLPVRASWHLLNPKSSGEGSK